MLEERSRGGSSTGSFPGSWSETLRVVIKWERNGEKREKEREKSSLYVRYNKKGSSNWGLKPPVVRSVHFSNRGSTHCLLCAQRMAHTKNTHQCGDKPKRTHFNTKMQHCFIVDKLWTPKQRLQLPQLPTALSPSQKPQKTPHIDPKWMMLGANFKRRLVWWKTTAVQFQLLHHLLTNSECWKRWRWKAAQCI